VFTKIPANFEMSFTTMVVLCLFCHRFLNPFLICEGTDFYIQTNAYSFSAVQFTVDEPTKLLDSYTANSDSTVTLTFKSVADVKTLVGTAGRTDAKKITIRALFLDNHSERKKAELVVRMEKPDKKPLPKLVEIALLKSGEIDPSGKE
jgi:hypothetical protein